METATLKRIDGGDEWELVEPLSHAYKSFRYTVLPGFRTDGASIPRIFWTWLGHPLHGEYVEAAVMHDATCRSGWLSLKLCDRLMADMMRAHGTPAETIRVVSLGLAISRLWRRQPVYGREAGRYLKVEAL